MLRRFRWFAGLRSGAAPGKRLVLAKPPRRRAQVGPAMLEAVEEVAVYIHRFHNLDLFQQGWYQIRISMRWEGDSYGSPGTPARIVQYETPDLGSDDIVGVWKIDDVDHSFTTHPFKIKYARQDVLLGVMISFNLGLGKEKILPTAAVILKFELLYSPILENGLDLQETFEAFPASVHEFRIPSKALLGLHSYCPVYFDAFHAVLIDLSIHIVLLKSETYTSLQKVSTSDIVEGDGTFVGTQGNDNQIAGEGLDASSKAIALVKSLSFAREYLVGDLLKLSKAIDQPLDDLLETDFSTNDLTGSLHLASEVSSSAAETFATVEEASNSGMERANGVLQIATEEKLRHLSMQELLNYYHSLGNQLLFTWNLFLKFHRTHRIRILEYLRNVWANDRRAEWSIWMVHSKIEMPTRYLRSGIDESSHHSLKGRSSINWRSGEDPMESSITRAELHRRSIAQMKFNSRSIQDMHIFGSPLHIPVVLVEQHVLNVPLHGKDKNLVIDLENHREVSNTHEESGAKPTQKSFGSGLPKSNRVLKVVVFVHGFQGHHLDLRLVRNQWLLIDPRVECLMSESNVDKTSEDFREMGKRLAEEVVSFLKKKMDKASRFGGFRDINISFVGHSIGNIIIRSALTDRVMAPFLRYLHTYMSVSGPHMGYLYSANSLFNSGLWVLKKLKGGQCIHQLTFTDDPDLEKTFFYNLSKQKTLEYFKNIILLSSPQDGYVPYHSARIELCQAASFDYSKRGQVFMDMLNNCLDQIRAPSFDQRTFMRCDVNFDTSSQGRSLNTFIGRAAHIEFLETDIFARFVMWSFPELFL